MSRTAPQLEQLAFTHYVILALAKNEIGRSTMIFVLQKIFNVNYGWRAITQLLKAGLATCDSRHLLRLTDSGAEVLEAECRRNDAINNLVIATRLANAADCSIYTLLKTAEQIRKRAFYAEHGVIIH